MHCPCCRANDYEIFLIETDDHYIGPLTKEAVIAINLITDFDTGITNDMLINVMVTCRGCGSWFIKVACESFQEAYALHAQKSSQP